MPSEVEPSAISVFGVTVNSRSGDFCEIMQMMNFLRDAKAEGFTDAIDELFYDSKNSYCAFKWKKGFEGIEKEHNHRVLQLALRHIAQFVWNDDMKHSPDSEMAEQES